jgi:hypothetical protein
MRQMRQKFLNLKSNDGQAMIIIVSFLGLMLVLGCVTISNTMHFNKIINIINGRAMAKESAEAGLAKAVWCLNQSSGEKCGGTFGLNYSGETDVFLGNSSFTTTIANKDANTKVITSTGYYPSSTSTLTKIVIKQEAGIDTDAASFHFGLQCGEGGLSMIQSAVVHGNVYSNGNVYGANSARIDGDVYVAGGTAPTTATEWTSKNNDFIFGQTSSAEDIAQSFSIPNSGRVTKVSLYIKKIGNPSNATIRIQTDSGGKPSGTNLGSGTLSASFVTGTMTWLDFTLSSPPMLSAGQKYWLVIDVPWYSSGNYWISGQDTTGGYPSQTGMKYKSSNPGKGWYDAGGDFNFKIWVGGEATYITGMEVNGDIHANTIDFCDIDSGGNAYATIIKNWTDVSGDAYTDEIYYSTVHGTTYLGQGPEDPPMENFPISDAQIAEWEADAAEGEPIQGDYTLSGGHKASLGPAVINGNLMMSHSGTELRMTGTLHVKGNLIISTQARIYLDSGYGSLSGVIVVDGQIILSQSVGIDGSGAQHSVLMVVSKKSGTAVTIDNSATAGVFYAPHGTAILSNHTTVKELTAETTFLSQSTEIFYEQGLINTNFTSGPSGGWVPIKGTWRIIK